MYQLRPALPRRRRRSSPASAGASLASHARTASWLNTRPRTRNISGRSVAQAQLVAQAPEHDEGDDVGRVLGPVQHRAGALVELPAAPAAAEPAIVLGLALG